MIKKKEVAESIRKNKPGLFGIQETKMKEVDGKVCKSMWGSKEFDFVFKASKVRFGGLLLIRNSKLFLKQIEFLDDHFIGETSCWDHDEIQMSGFIKFNQNERWCV